MKRGSKKGENRQRAHQVTPENIRWVETAMRAGLTVAKCAEALEITEPTFYKYYGQRARVARANAEALVGMVVFKNAVQKENQRAAEFFLTHRCGWKPTTVTEVSGPDGGPIQGKVSLETELAGIAALIQPPKQEEDEDEDAA